MRVTIIVNSAMELNLSSFMAPMEFIPQGDGLFSIKLKKTGLEYGIIEQKMIGFLSMDRDPEEKPFEINGFEDHGEFINLSCTLKRGTHVFPSV